MIPEPLSVAGIVGGVASGAINVARGAKELAKYFLEKQDKADLQLVGKIGTVQDLKEIRRSPDYAEYSKFITDKRMLQWVRIGLLFRKLYRAPEELLAAKTKLESQGGRQAVAVAQCVQFDILSILRKTLAAGRGATDNLAQELSDFLSRAADLAYFVRSDQDLARQAREIETRLHAHNPSVFVVAGSGYAAEMAQEICRQLKDAVTNHRVGTMGDHRDFQGVFAWERRR